MTRALRMVGVVMAGLLLSGSALADKAGKGEGREDKREHRGGDGGAGHRHEAGDGGADDKGDRKERQKAHMAELRAKWGAILKIEGVREEMRMHSSRLARLRRIDKLAKAGGKEAIAKRAEAAIEKEKARHDKKMDELKSKQAAPAASGGAK